MLNKSKAIWDKRWNLSAYKIARLLLLHPNIRWISYNAQIYSSWLDFNSRSLELLCSHFSWLWTHQSMDNNSNTKCVNGWCCPQTHPQCLVLKISNNRLVVCERPIMIHGLSLSLSSFARRFSWIKKNSGRLIIIFLKRSPQATTLMNMSTEIVWFNVWYHMWTLISIIVLSLISQ